MKSFLLLLCGYLTWKCKLLDARQIHRDARIIGGSVARVGQFPWQAAIYVHTSTELYFCGGALINQQWVVTAGQCVFEAEQFTVTLGTNDLKSNDENKLTLSTSTYVIHPDYNPETLEHDVGLIKFHMPIEYTNYIQKITIANMGQIHAGVQVTASGWGQTSDNAAGLSDELYFVNLVTISNNECQITYGTQIKNGMVCTVGNYNEGICLGDTGSPIIKPGIKGEPLHVGVASFMSQNGCETAEPTGYTRTDVYHNWIYNISKT